MWLISKSSMRYSAEFCKSTSTPAASSAAISSAFAVPTVSGVFSNVPYVTCGDAMMRRSPISFIFVTRLTDVATSGDPSSMPGNIWQCMSVSKNNFSGWRDLLNMLNITIIVSFVLDGALAARRRSPAAYYAVQLAKLQKFSFTPPLIIYKKHPLTQFNPAPQRALSSLRPPLRPQLATAPSASSARLSRVLRVLSARRREPAPAAGAALSGRAPRVAANFRLKAVTTASLEGSLCISRGQGRRGRPQPSVSSPRAQSLKGATLPFNSNAYIAD